MMDWQTVRYFKPAEFACKCGCGLGADRMDIMTVRYLDVLRHELKQPMILSSAYRCPDHNARVSSTGRNGPHTTGKAVDVRISGHAAAELVRIAARAKVPGIGIQQKGLHASRFIHLDWCDNNETGPRPWVWSY